ncbi:hypothetical protein [Bordetella bronchiseptica]|nr:hypothetical protein [Bordetella bronchiseptica]AMG89627.1 hypothetical protein AL472_19190 [Bordetella bronchiseptica]
MSMPTLNRQQRRQLEQQRSRQRAQRRVERPAHPPMLIKAQQTLAPLEAIIDQIERAGTVDTDRQGRPIFHCAADGQWYESAPQAPAGWRWTLHPAGLHPDVYAAAAAHTSDEARNAALEEAAGALEDHRRAGREWVPGSLWDALSREAAARIRALKSPTIATEAHQISQLRSTVEDLKKLFRQERGRCGEIRNATLEEAAELADGCDKRATPRGIACAIRAIKSTPAPTAVEGANDVALPPCPQALVKVEGMPRYLWPEMQAYARAAVLADRQRRSGDAPREDDMLTIAYLAGAQAEKERAALSAQPGAIRNPLIAEPSGNPGELDCAALSARKEGDARASATQAEQGERDAG